MFTLLKKKSDKTIACNDCKFFNNDPKKLESLFPGILILSSCYSSSRGDAGICEYHDLFLLPGIICEQFKNKSVQFLLDTSQNNFQIKLPYSLMIDDRQGHLSSGKSVMEPQASQGQDSGTGYA
ncbi:MAG: hypothetical protein LWX01_02560 [Deltaproteobacteria bacterium]|nr:hypothetical protein [Deltaproteobacteria bacterium]MDL1960576.1 hypothetical protein [Deltaproteobacteria bacterium]